MGDLDFDPVRVAQQVEALAVKALARAAIILVNRIKETLSVPAPRRRVVSASGAVYYRATTKATPGDPPRKLSGRLRAAQTWQTMRDGQGPFVRVGSSIVYARRHELGVHPFLVPTLQRHQAEITAALAL